MSYKQIVIEGSFFAPSGYSTVTRQFAYHFIKNLDILFDYTVDVYLKDIHWDRNSVKDVLSDDMNNTLTEHQYRGETIYPDDSLLLRWGSPHAFPEIKEEYKTKILYFVWELDRLPNFWVQFLDKYDAFITASKFSATAIKRTLNARGINKKIFVVPHAKKDEYGKISDKKLTKDEVFTFTTVGTFIERKAIAEAVLAYCQTFTEDDPVKYYIKLTGVDAGGMLNIKRNLQKMLFNKDDVNKPKIVLDNSIISTDQMKEMYNHSDCLVQVSRGEAFSMPILEGMACGTPSIVLDEGGHMDYVTENTSIIVPNTGKELSNGDGLYQSINGLYWYTFDEGDIGERMKYIYNNQDVLEKLSENGLKQIRKYTWLNIAKRFTKVLNKL